MTRHDFTIIAQILADADLDPFARASVAQDFAQELKEENPRFNETLFLKACGV